jgi:hypothetical protein
MPKISITDAKGLTQSTGGGVTIESKTSLTNTSGIVLGNTDQTVGVLTSKIDTGIINHMTVITTPAPAASLATGIHTITAANLALGFLIVTANSTTVAVTMPTKAHMLSLMGGASNITIGDSFVWYLHNAGTTVNQSLVLTGRTGMTIVGNTKVAANAADMETATTGGTSTGTFMTRIIATDGGNVTYRLA